MSLWNPYAFTPTGQPVAPVAPPALRVIGGQATAQQLTHAQDAFYRFCASTRLSAVPNPVETGRLPDGTQYRIVVVGPQTIMEIWQGGSDVPQKAHSGILFMPSRTLLVNDGKMDAPSAKWRIVPDIPHDLIAPNLYSGVAGRRLTVSKYTPKVGAGQYFYGHIFGRYGNEPAFLFGAPNGVTGMAGMTWDGRLDMYQFSTVTRQLQIYRSEEKETYKLLPKYGEKPVPVVLSLSPAEVIVAANAASNITVGPTTNKRGDKIAFVSDYFEPITIGVDFVPGQPFLHRTPYPFDGRVQPDGFIWVAGPSPQQYWRYKQTAATDIKVSSRAASGEFQPPQTTKTLPMPTIEPPTRFIGSASDGRVVFSNTITSMNMSNISHPRDVCTQVYDISRIKADTYDLLTYSFDSVAAGDIGFTLKRDEDSTYVRALEYTGADEIVPTLVRDRLSYTQTVSGSMDFRRTDRASGDIVLKGREPSIKVGDFNPVGANRSLSHEYSASTAIHMERETVLALGAKEQHFVEYREIYDETGSFLSKITKVENFSYLQDSEYSVNNEFTLRKEARSLLVFDPAWDLICYTELVTTVSNTASLQRTVAHSGSNPAITESNSGGGPLPPEPKKYVVVKFRGAETRFSMPYLSPDDANDAALRRNALRRLYPATGIAPGNPPNGSIDTLGAFYNFDISIAPVNDDTLLYNARVINIYEAPPSGPIVVSSAPEGIRGVSSKLYVGDATPQVTYTKTPETGAALLTIYLNRRGVVIDKRYLFDAAGMRDADAVVSGIPETNNGVESPRGPY